MIVTSVKILQDAENVTPTSLNVSIRLVFHTNGSEFLIKNDLKQFLPNFVLIDATTSKIVPQEKTKTIVSSASAINSGVSQTTNAFPINGDAINTMIAQILATNWIASVMKIPLITPLTLEMAVFILLRMSNRTLALISIEKINKSDF